ncbi:mCG147374 [Mus musculus]|jgi:hypothetical protein|nr:mCG147374 [Mus musculus]
MLQHFIKGSNRALVKSTSAINKGNGEGVTETIQTQVLGKTSKEGKMRES